MAFPTGKTTSGVKSDTREGTYKYYTGVQPNTGTKSIGNWNTGGDFAGIGNSKGVYDAGGNLVGGSPPKVGKGGMSELAALFQGGKGGPTGGVGTVGIVNPALKTRRPMMPPEAVSLPPGAASWTQEQYDAYVAQKTAEARARMASWINQGYNPLSSTNIPRAGYSGAKPGAPYPNPGGGYDPSFGWQKEPTGPINENMTTIGKTNANWPGPAVVNRTGFGR